MTLIESETRLRAARGIAKSETQGAIEAFKQLKRRGHPHSPPPLISDGWGGYEEAMVEVWGKVPEYRGIGRPPTKKKPQSGWQYLQMVKQRENGRVIGVKPKAIYGDEWELRQLLGESTSYVERTNLTSRHMNGRLVRKTLGYSKKLAMLEASSIWEDAIYNLGRAHKSLRIESPEDATRHWKKRSPAMAAGLTDHIWRIEELLTVLPIPPTNT